MSEQVFEILATQLGELSQRWTCPRCFWVRSRLKGQLPYQQFPAVFSQIDRFSKDLIKQSFASSSSSSSSLGDGPDGPNGAGPSTGAASDFKTARTIKPNTIKTNMAANIRPREAIY